MIIRVMIDCPFCKGSLEKECPECDGTGIDALDGGQCPTCSGTGEVDCDFVLCEGGSVCEEELEEYIDIGGYIPPKSCDGCYDGVGTNYYEEDDEYLCDDCYEYRLEEDK